MLRQPHLSLLFPYTTLFRSLLTVLMWGFATVAGRGAMRELPLGLGAPLRLWAGLLTTAVFLGLRALTGRGGFDAAPDRKSTRLNSSHVEISYAVFCLKKKK